MEWEGGGRRVRKRANEKGWEREGGGYATYRSVSYNSVAHMDTCATEFGNSVAHIAICATEYPPPHVLPLAYVGPIGDSVAHTGTCATELFLWRTCPYAPQNLGHPMCWLWPTWDPPKSCGALAYMRHRKGIFCGAYVPMRHRISTFLWRTSLHAPQKKILWRTRSICATE